MCNCKNIEKKYFIYMVNILIVIFIEVGIFVVIV